MRRRTVIPIAVTVLLAAAAITTAVLLRRSLPPESARLLPEADAYVFANLSILRKAGVFERMAAVSKEPEYEQFVRETGFQFERDLDEVSFAVHGAPGQPPGSSPTAAQPMDHRFSEVFIGTFNSERAAAYFRKLAASAEHYRETDIYNIPHDGRTVRVAILDPRAVAVSNAQDTAAIHHIIDRHKELALPKAGPSLVRSYYRQVPFASLGWAILRTSTNGQNNRLLVLPGGYDLFLPGSSVVVASLRYLGQVQLRAEAFTSNEQQASRITEQLGAFLALFRSVETSVETHGPDQDVKQFFDSLKIEQNKERAILTANVPVGFLKKMVSESSASELGADQRGQENVPQPEKTIPRPGQKGPAHKNPKQN